MALADLLAGPPAPPVVAPPGLLGTPTSNPSASSANAYMAALARQQSLRNPQTPQRQAPSMYRPNSTPLPFGEIPPPRATPAIPGVSPAIPSPMASPKSLATPPRANQSFRRTPMSIPLRQANTANKANPTPFSDYRGTTMGSPSGHMSSVKGFSS